MIQYMMIQYIKLPPDKQQIADDIARFPEIMKKTMSPSCFKAAGTRAANNNNNPLYAHIEEYLTSYTNAFESKRLANDKEITTKQQEIAKLQAGVASKKSTKDIARVQTEIQKLEADNLTKENLSLKADEESKKKNLKIIF